MGVSGSVNPSSVAILPGPTVAGAASQYLDYLDTVTTSGYYTKGDGGGALYRKVAVQPTHAGKFQSAGGTWWELSETIVAVEMFGAKGDGATDDLAAFQAAISYATATSNPVGLSNRTYRLTRLIQRWGFEGWREWRKPLACCRKLDV